MLTPTTGLWMIPAFPAAAALLIFTTATQLRKGDAGRIAVSGCILALAAVLYHGVSMLSGRGGSLQESLWTWLDAGPVQSQVGFYFDNISLVFCLVITGVGSLIQLFSTEYMAGDEGERRFFGYLSLFVASMLVLVTAGDAFFMFLGWEGVGACSFALIGHYYTKRENAGAAMKAFLVTRLGDVFLVLGVTLAAAVSTVNFSQLMNLNGAHAVADQASPFGPLTGTTLAYIIGVLLLLGAAGKSAQVPLQTWLPDAMAGPTPVSALIHAATMVTAGVYLIARFHPIFAQSPQAMTVVALVGLATAIYGATCAIVQTDIKRILAYSTISQIGYMVLGLGVGAYSAALFHFFTHAFYKALLFLGAGYVIHALHGEQNIYKMGGLKEKLPRVYGMMLAGAASLAGIPLITAGFFSKDAILWSALTTSQGNFLFYGVGLLTAALTAVYSFRLIYVVFHGSPRSDYHVHAHGHLMEAAMLPLAGLALVAGWLNVPHILPLWDRFFAETFKHAQLHASHSLAGEVIGGLVGGGVAIAGAFAAWKLFGPGAASVLPTASGEIAESTINSLTPYKSPIVNALYRGWDFDRVYSRTLVQPSRWLFGTLAWFDYTVLASIFEIIAMIVRGFHSMFESFQNGRIQRYAVVMLAGAAAIAILFFILPKA